MKFGATKRRSCSRTANWWDGCYSSEWRRSRMRLTESSAVQTTKDRASSFPSISKDISFRAAGSDDANAPRPRSRSGTESVGPSKPSGGVRFNRPDSRSSFKTGKIAQRFQAEMIQEVSRDHECNRTAGRPAASAYADPVQLDQLIQ